MRRWICSLIVILIAFSVVIQHGGMSASAGLPNHQMQVEAVEATPAATSAEDHRHHVPEAGLAEVCAIVCLGTPTPWMSTGQYKPVATARSLSWMFAAIILEGRGVGPGYRPPKFI